MKKPRPAKQSSASFNNNPFKSLRSLKPRAGSVPAVQTFSPRKEEEENETDLFLRAVSGVRTIDPALPRPAEERKTKTAKEASGGDDQRLFLQAMQKLGGTLPDPEAKPDLDDPPRKSASSRMNQLRRGAIRLGEELDLHGRKRDEALVKLEQFVVSAYAKRQRAVLVITGKGINSPEGPVLQGAVSGWLREKGQRFVAEFAPAPRNLGGSGAYVVFLRNRQDD